MRRIPLLLLGACYIGVFLWGYATIVAPTFATSGFQYAWPGAASILWIFFLSLIPVTILPTTLSRPSGFIVWWLYVTAYVPSQIMPVVSLPTPPVFLLPLQLTVLATMVLLCLVPETKTLVLPRLVISERVFSWSLATVWLACILFCLSKITLANTLANFSLLLAGESEYALRDNFFRHIESGGRLIAYAANELSRGLDPFLIAIGLVRRRPWLLVAGMAGQIIYFGQTGTKDALFGLVAIFACSSYLLPRRERFASVFLSAFIGLVVVSTVFDLVTHTTLLSTHITRRTLAAPGLLTGFYFEHYSLAPHPGHNFTGTGNFQVYGPPQEIGLYYFGSVNVDANANFWAEGFAEYGFLGIFGFALLIAFMLWLYDSVTVRHPLSLAVLVAVMQADALANSTPLTILVTHGGLLVGLLLFLLPASDADETTILAPGGAYAWQSSEASA